MDNILHFRQNKSVFDLKFQNEKLFFDIGFEGDGIIFFWYRKFESKKEVVYQEEVKLNQIELLLVKVLGTKSQRMLKKKALNAIYNAMKDFNKKIVHQGNMDNLVMEIMDAGQINVS